MNNVLIKIRKFFLKRKKLSVSEFKKITGLTRKTAIPFLEYLPGGSGTITGNFAVTGALALITFVAIIIAGTMKHGFIGHWKNMIPGGLPAPVLLILIPVEIMGSIALLNLL